MGRAVRIGAFLVAFLVGWFAWQWAFGGFPFPEEIAGVPRMEGEQVEDVRAVFESVFELQNIEIELALYGDGPLPSYVMYAAEIPEGQTVEEMWAGLERASGGVAPALPVSTTGAQFGCMDNPGGRGGASCMWLDDGVLVEVYGLNETSSAIRPIAEDVREQSS